MNLYEATKEFEKILPKSVVFPGLAGLLFDDTDYGFNTWKDEAFGMLHRVYWDETDLENEDPNLISILQPFVTKTGLLLSGNSQEVVALRLYVAAREKAKKRNKYRSIDAHSSW